MFKKTQTLAEMEQAGWAFSPPRPCSKCQEPVSWAAHPSTGKNYSFDAYTPNFHWKHCSGNDQAGRAPAASPSLARASAPARPAPAPAAETHSLQGSIDDLAHAVRSLISELKARKSAPAPARKFDENGCPTD